MNNGTLGFPQGKNDLLTKRGESNNDTRPFQLQEADGTTAGGNARGTNAIDLQTTRTAATQVASGAGAFVAGQNNTASGNFSVAIGVNNTCTGANVAIGNNNNATTTSLNQGSVAIGRSNTANDPGAVALGDSCTSSALQAFAAGFSSTASAAYSAAIGISCQASGVGAVALGSRSRATGAGGFAAGGADVSTNPQNLASGNSSVAIGNLNTASGAVSVAMGSTNTASGTASSCPGGANATTNSIQGLLAYGFNGTTQGQNQMTFTGLRPSTTGATATRATADNAAATATNQLTLRNNSAVRFQGSVIARDTVTNDSKEWSFTGLIKRGANAAATALVGTPSVTSSFADTAAAAWTLDVAADTTNGALAVNVTGSGTNAIRWTVVIQSSEVA